MSIKEIKNKILSVKDTEKITRTMQMISASKMRSAKERIILSRPYAEKVLHVISHLSKAHPEYRHQYLIEREVKSVGLIIITTDRGLCGSLNGNILRVALKKIDDYSRKKIAVNLCLLGDKADNFFREIDGCKVVAKGVHIEEDTKLEDLIGSVNAMLEFYDEEQIDALYLCYNRFINTMIQKPVMQKLLPIAIRESTEHWDYIYEPDAKEILTRLLSRYIESQVYQGTVENYASEQAARMIAMMNATDNALKLIDDLNLKYNRARQAGITQEISEIINGAKALLE